MKKIIFLVSAIIILSSCKLSDDPNSDLDLVGSWNLIEVLADPGDGSGTFLSVESNKTITFLQDGTITSNGTLCNMSEESNNSTSGTYSTADSTFSSPDCDNPEYNFSFEQNGSILIINYPCIEPCQAKYEKQ